MALIGLYCNNVRVPCGVPLIAPPDGVTDPGASRRWRFGAFANLRRGAAGDEEDFFFRFLIRLFFKKKKLTLQNFGHSGIFGGFFFPLLWFLLVCVLLCTVPFRLPWWVDMFL